MSGTLIRSFAMEWNTALESFGSSLGIDALVPDADGSCSLLFDGENEVTFTHDEEDHSLLLYCEIGSAASLSKDACLALLKSSLLGAETGGAALSVHGALDSVVLWKRFDDNALTPETMKIAVNGFLAQVAAWKKRLAELCAAPGVEEAPSESSSLDTMSNFGMFV